MFSLLPLAMIHPLRYPVRGGYHGIAKLESPLMHGRSPWWGEKPWGVRGGEVQAVERAVASRLDQALRRLEALCSPTPDPTSVGTVSLRAPGLSCQPKQPASPDAIAETELRLGTALPGDYKQFLHHWDGATLFAVDESSSTSLELLGTAALVRHAEEVEREYPAWCIPELVIFASVGNDGDRLAFETGRMNPYGGCAVLDARGDYRPDQWWVIARDFTSWLEAVLHDTTGGGSFGRHWGQKSHGLQPELPFPVDE
jgi:hypothetical protein